MGGLRGVDGHGRGGRAVGGDPSVSTSDLNEVHENVRNTHELLRAHWQFRNEVGALMLRLVERDDPAGFVLLELIRDLDARTGELYVEENR